jgi:hypothetical protein
VECVLVDALGHTHLFVEKTPVVSTENLLTNSSFPRLGAIDCEIEDEVKDSAIQSMARVSTVRPWGIESTTGATHFVVFLSQLVQA